MDLAAHLDKVNDAKGPDLTDRLKAVLERLRPAQIGTFTMEEFALLRRYNKWRAMSVGPFRLHKFIDGIDDGRDPESELRVVLQLEALAEKVDA